MIVRTSDFTITPCGQLRSTGGCRHPECADGDFGAQGEVVDVGLAGDHLMLYFDWGYTIVVLPTTEVIILDWGGEIDMLDPLYGN